MLSLASEMFGLAMKSWVTSAGNAQSYVRSTLVPDGVSPTESTLFLVPALLVEETPTGRDVLRSGQMVWRATSQSHKVKNTSDKPAACSAL
jgi:hypothetical protein